MKILAVQFDIAWEDPPANYRKIRALLQSASPVGGELLVLPEMFSTGFSMTTPPAPGDREFLSTLARDFNLSILAGILSSDPDGKKLNQALLISPDGAQSACFTKLHPFSPAGEHELFSPGSQVIVAPFQGLHLAPFICYDLRFPESFRRAVQLNADLLIVIANWPAPRIDHWTTLLRARAIENQSFVLGVNRTGQDPHHQYPGQTIAFSPTGQILAQLGSEESILRVTFDPALLRQSRAAFPALTDIRPV